MKGAAPMPSPAPWYRVLWATVCSRLPFLGSRHPWLGFASTVIVACLWLNQGPSLQTYERSLGESAATGWVSALVRRAHQPFAFLYRRSADEELYFDTALAIRGLPFDRSLLLRTHEGASAEFANFPAPDGRMHIPYAEVSLEYPAFVLPFILLPAFATSSFEGFARLFGLLMAVCLLAACGLCIHADPRSRPDWTRERWWLASGLLLAEGALAIQRLDALIAVLLALSLWAAARGKPTVAGVALGLAVGTKSYPPCSWRPCGRRTEPRATAVDSWCVPWGESSSASPSSLGPMLALSPHAIASVLHYHVSRGLHVESTFGLGLALREWSRGPRAPPPCPSDPITSSGRPRMFSQP